MLGDDSAGSQPEAPLGCGRSEVGREPDVSSDVEPVFHPPTPGNVHKWPDSGSVQFPSDLCQFLGGSERETDAAL